MVIILIHGYSDGDSSLLTWQEKLKAQGFDDIRLCNYQTLSNEINISDIAEAFDQALREQTGLLDNEPFDAIVHSTGMLVIRAWLAHYAGRRERVKRLIGLAPATFGSPLAHKGKSFLGVLAKGNRQRGPDFGEAGKQVLSNLELASPFTWNLAHLDLLGDVVMYGPNNLTPYVFIFIGDTQYGGLRKMLAGESGTDGTVRWAGCAMNSRKITIDLTRGADSGKRFQVGAWRSLDMPCTLSPGLTMPTSSKRPAITW